MIIEKTEMKTYLYLLWQPVTINNSNAMRLLFPFYLLILIMGCQTNKKPMDVQVTISSGKIEGVYDEANEMHIFKGIPYAAPPVGSLRWRAPQPTQIGRAHV